MRRLERLHAITNHLRAHSPRSVSVAALAQRFEVSTRTIERDLQSLLTAGVPIYATQGRGGGYAILPDFAMPPVRLTAQEAAACLAGLALLQHSPLATHARTAADKLAATLPAPVRETARATTVLTAGHREVPPTGVWVDAVQEYRLVSLTYGTEPAPRLVEPYTAMEAGGSWYLIGWCRTRNAVRGFRTDKVSSITATSTSFIPTHAGAVADDLSRWRPSRLDVWTGTASSPFSSALSARGG